MGWELVERIYPSVSNCYSLQIKDGVSCLVEQASEEWNEMSSESFAHDVKWPFLILREYLHKADHKLIEIIFELLVHEPVRKHVRSKTEARAHREIQIDDTCIAIPRVVVPSDVKRGSPLWVELKVEWPVLHKHAYAR